MTKEQIDAIERLYAERSDSLIASGYSIPELIAAARRALELEEALEGLLEWSIIRSDWLQNGKPEPSDHPISVARKAIQNARRGM